jgi:hypothetical protein
MTRPYEELCNTPREELIREYDAVAKTTEPSLNYYREELAHRVLESHSETMVNLTHRITWLTVVIAFLTAANTLLVAWQVLRHP